MCNNLLRGNGRGRFSACRVIWVGHLRPRREVNFLSHFLLPSAGGKNFLSCKVNIARLWAFFSKKHFLPLAPPVATVYWSKIHLSQTLHPVPKLC